MLSLLLGFAKSLLFAFGQVMDFLSSERFRKLGRLEAEQEQYAQEKKNEAIAREVDALPVPRDKSTILAGLRKPENK